MNLMPLASPGTSIQIHITKETNNNNNKKNPHIQFFKTKKLSLYLRDKLKFYKRKIKLLPFSFSHHCYPTFHHHSEIPTRIDLWVFSRKSTLVPLPPRHSKPHPSQKAHQAMTPQTCSRHTNRVFKLHPREWPHGFTWSLLSHHWGPAKSPRSSLPTKPGLLF